MLIFLVFLFLSTSFFWTIAWNGILYAKLYNNTNLGRTKGVGTGPVDGSAWACNGRPAFRRG